MLSIILTGLFLFIIIYLAVRLAINPLIDKQEEEVKDDISLVDLRDMDVITNMELEDIMRLYQSKVMNNRAKERYTKYSRVLIELKDIGYFSEDVLNEKLDILKDAMTHE